MTRCLVWSAVLFSQVNTIFPWHYFDEEQGKISSFLSAAIIIHQLISQANKVSGYHHNAVCSNWCQVKLIQARHIKFNVVWTSMVKYRYNENTVSQCMQIGCSVFLINTVTTFQKWNIACKVFRKFLMSWKLLYNCPFFLSLLSALDFVSNFNHSIHSV